MDISNLPFGNLNDDELTNILNDDLVSNCFLNRVFDPGVIFDRYDGVIDPSIFSTNIDCNYLNLDEIEAVLNIKNLNLISYNVRSIPKHFDEFLNEVNYSNFDVLCFSETRLTEFTQNLFNLPDYEGFYSNRNSSGGGVAIYAKKAADTQLISDFTLMRPYFESIFVEYRRGKENFLIGNIYRPPNSDINSFLELLESILSSIQTNFSEHKIYMVGDYNLDLFRLSESHPILNYFNCFTSMGFHPLIVRPTRVSNTSQTLIDQIWTNDTGAEITSALLLTDISDHFPIICCRKSQISEVNKKCTVTYESRLRGRQCDEKFRNYLLNHNWNPILDLNSAEGIYDKFCFTLWNFYDLSYPNVTKTKPKIDCDKPYITAELKSLIKEKHKIQRKFYKFPITYGSQYKSIKNKVARLTSRAKKEYFQNRFDENLGNPRSYWADINELCGRKSGKSFENVKTIEGELIPKDDLPTEFNEYFINKPTELARKFDDLHSFREYLSGNAETTFQLNPITIVELSKFITDVKNTSPGFDELPIRIFKENFDILGPIILHLCNTSILTGVFPTGMKIARVIPIPKSASRCINNFRPISLLPTLSKILEKIVSIQLNSYLIHNNIITPNQFGFRPNLSTENAAHDLVNYIYKSFDEGKFCIGMFLDLSKAFDTLNTEILLYKLNHYGIRGRSHEWFRSYLSDRKQFTSISDYSSDCTNILRGVPQGSTLGPILFTIYINDVIKSSPLFKYVLYADDTSLLYSHSDIKELIQVFNSEISEVARWFKYNHLTLNLSKCSYIVFHRDGRKVPENLSAIMLGGMSVQRVYEARFLGVILDESLKFNGHIVHTCKKVSKFLPILYKVRKVIDITHLLRIYNGLVHPQFLYCLSVWGGCSATHFKPLVVLHKKILRCMTGLRRRESVQPVYSSLRILPLHKLYEHVTCAFVYKSISLGNNLFSERINNFYVFRNSDQQLLDLPRVFYTHSKQCILYSGPNFYNLIPLDIRNSPSFNSFKVRLKSFLLNSIPQF